MALALVKNNEKEAIKAEIKGLKKERRKLYYQHEITEAKQALELDEYNVKMTFIRIEKSKHKRDSKGYKKLSDEWMKYYNMRKTIETKYELEYYEYRRKVAILDGEIAKLELKLED